MMFSPGANRSVHAPKLEKPDRRSVTFEAFTVTAAGRRAGEKAHASAVLLPAATATVTPALIAPCTASSSGWKAPPDRLMLATAGRTAFCATQLTPLITVAALPLPRQ